MKRALLFIAVALISFTAGLAGLFFAMPIIQPESAELTRAHIDSMLGRVAVHEIDSLIRLDSSSVFAEEFVLADSSDAGEDSVQAVPLEEHPRYVALLDSLHALHLTHAALADEQSSLERRNVDLVDQVTDLERRIEESAAVLQDAAELSATLSRLEDDELNRIVSRLEDGTLRALYREASGRNQTKILRALPADRAARFVQSLMSTDHTRPVRTALSNDSDAG